MKPCSVLKGEDTVITFQWPLLLKQQGDHSTTVRLIGHTEM